MQSPSDVVWDGDQPDAMVSFSSFSSSASSASVHFSIFQKQLLLIRARVAWWKLLGLKWPMVCYYFLNLNQSGLLQNQNKSTQIASKLVRFKPVNWTGSIQSRFSSINQLQFGLTILNWTEPLHTPKIRAYCYKRVDILYSILIKWTPVKPL